MAYFVSLYLFDLICVNVCVIMYVCVCACRGLRCSLGTYES